MSLDKSGVLYGLLSAVLFGASTPLAKELVGAVDPLWLASLLYVGAGTGLLGVLAVRVLAGDGSSLSLPRKGDWRWIGGAIALGGVAGPAALMYGLAGTSGAAASLLLNLEPVFTALLAWFVFRENFDRRIAWGLACVAGGAVLLTGARTGGSTSALGPLLVTLACLCWALDNNLTRKVSGSDPAVLASIKGLAAGVFNGALAFGLGFAVPSPGVVTGAAAIGFLGYGLSLVLFILALRHVGAARAGAYFSVAPFFGAVLAVALGQDPITWSLMAAAMLMAVGVWLHVSERHAHAHEHEPIEHTHLHEHDEHHRHEHEVPWDGSGAHVHAHVHARLRHSHPHYPDLHHRHGH